MSKKGGIFFLLVVVVFISGCYSIDITHSIEPEGLSSISIIMNMTSLIDSMPDNATEGIDNSSMTFESGCADYENNTLITCSEISLGVIQLEGDFEVPLIETESLQETRYTYDALFVFDILAALSDDPTEQLTQDNLGEMEMLNPELTYIVSMPGTILTSEVGDIFENVVIIDLFDLESVQSANIVSSVEKELPWTLIGMIGGGVVLAIIIITLLLVGSLKKNHPKVDANELACKTYIGQYKQTYSAEQLKQGLIASGHDPVKVTEYVQKYY